jgi:Exosome component EXOSC1/CSL4
VLGSITRLSPQQAVVSITVVDGVPLPLGEDFTGVIRVQDIRATEKDKVKVGDCFRGGDVIRGLVVCRTIVDLTRLFPYLVTARYLLEMRVATTSLLRGTTLESFLLQAKLVREAMVVLKGGDG